MGYLQMAQASGASLVQNVFPGDSTHLAPAIGLPAPSAALSDAAPAASYNPEWNPTGIEGGVDANTLPWISFPEAAGCSYKPLRASRETGRFSLVVRMAKGTVQPDLVHLGAADFMVLSGKMTYPSGPMAGTLEAGVWGYVPAEARIFGLVADEDVEYLMNFYGPIAFLAADKKSVSSLFTCSDVRQAAAQRGITLIPSTLSECMQPRPAEYSGPADPLAISADGAAALCTRATGIAKQSAKLHPHYVDTKAMEWFESMPGVGLKILRVSEETGVVTAMVRHMATAPPHYHLGAADFMMLAGHLGYRAGPPEGYGPGTWFFEPAGARHESTQNVAEEETMYLANVYGPIQFDSGVGAPVVAVLSWMGYLQMAQASGASLVQNVFPGDSTHLAPAIGLPAPSAALSDAAPAASYNPEWNPTGIEGGVDANTLPWISFPKAAGCSYKPLRASRETGRFSLVVRMAKGTVQPDLVHLGAADFMVLSGKMTYPSGPMAGTLEAGVWGYVPADAKIVGLEADEDVEYLMNYYGPIAFLSADKKSVSSLFTCSDVRQAAAQRGITLIPSTLSECMQPRPAEYSGPGDPLAISADGAAALCTRAIGIAKESAKLHPHYVDTKAMEWFESMPGVGLKILRVSEETGVVTAMVRHMATAPPHYHLGAADFFMLQGRLGYRA